MIAYIIKSSLCLMLLWAFYKLLLEKENIHFIKRFYLLFSLGISFIIPMITLTYEVEVMVSPEMISENTIPMIMSPETVAIVEPIDYTSFILWSIYVMGVLVFGFRFIQNITDISKRIRTNEQLKESSHINVLVCSAIVPHTFLSYIFVPKKDFQDHNIPEEVLLHEKTHVSQKHTLDILFVEILQVIFWFNPIFIFIKRSIKLNHEFLADQNVLKQRFSIQNYVDLLLNYPNSSNQAILSSPINYSLTKKRLQMMTKEFSKKRAMLKLITLAPILSLCVLFFNNEIVAKEVERPMEEVMFPDIEELNTLEKSSIIVLKDKEESSSLNQKQNSVQEGVTKEMVKEYNVWAKDLHAKIKGNKPITISESEIYRMINIYRNMTTEQRKGSEQFPDIPPPPPVPEAPKVKKGEKSDIPPPPPPPEAPKVSKGEKSDIPPPPPPPSKAPKVKKGEKSNIPPPPPPTTPKGKNGTAEQSKKAKKIKTKDGYAEILLSEKEDLTEQEKAELKERVQNELARERAEVERVRAEIERERVHLQREEAIAMVEEIRQEQKQASQLAMLNAEESRQIAEKARAIAIEAASKVKDDNGDRQQVLENARISREAAEKARVMALIASREARARSEKEIKKAQSEALKIEREIRKAEMQARKKALEAEMESRKAVKKAEMQAHKAQMEARKSAREAEMRARLASRNHSSEKLIESMAKKDADFYYNGKEISAKEALKLVEDSNNNLSIDASTKNGKSRVKLKD
ncbi:M56 family metallopeptidase [Aquimarina sp. SS2-1]|uniref:M56 family metallopeptidase n=1 Tax=Aquimarina besae TaxID=3342247 RepID=UPI00366DD46F